MSHRCKVELDAEFFTEVVKLFGGEVVAVVRDDAMRDAEPAGESTCLCLRMFCEFDDNT